MNAIYLLAAAGSLMAIGDLSLALWARNGQLTFIVTGLLLNLLGIFAYANTMAAENIGIATAVVLGLNLLIMSLFGIFVLHDPISTARAAGLVLLASSIVFIEVIV